MNKKATYEITITEKLGQLPLPELEDAIWTRIENSLDLEMPTDDGPGGDGGGPVKPSGGQFPLYFGLSAFLLALISFYFLSQNKPLPPFNTPATSTPIKETIQPDKPPDRETVPYTTPVLQTPPGYSKAKLSPPFEDSVENPLENNTGALPPPEEIVTTRTAAPPAVLPSADTLAPQKKKGKGVTGLTDNDYRIVPAKRDSTD